MPIAKLAAFLDMVRKPEVSFQFQTRKLFLLSSVNKLRIRTFCSELAGQIAGNKTKRDLCPKCDRKACMYYLARQNGRFQSRIVVSQPPSKIVNIWELKHATFLSHGRQPEVCCIPI